MCSHNDCKHVLATMSERPFKAFHVSIAEMSNYLETRSRLDSDDDCKHCPKHFETVLSSVDHGNTLFATSQESEAV